MALHWLMAMSVMGTFAVGPCMPSLASSPTRLKRFDWHRWAGLCILALPALPALLALRLLWRRCHWPRADLPTSAWQRRAPYAAHRLPWALFFAVPLAGCACVSASGFPTVLFDVLPLPDFVPGNR